MNKQQRIKTTAGTLEPFEVIQLYGNYFREGATIEQVDRETYKGIKYVRLTLTNEKKGQFVRRFREDEIVTLYEWNEIGRMMRNPGGFQHIKGTGEIMERERKAKAATLMLQEVIVMFNHGYPITDITHKKDVVLLTLYNNHDDSTFTYEMLSEQEVNLKRIDSIRLQWEQLVRFNRSCPEFVVEQDNYDRLIDRDEMAAVLDGLEAVEQSFELSLVA